MSKGYALAIGLNGVDPVHYDGWDGALNVCEADAKKIFSYLKRKNSDRLQSCLLKKLQGQMLFLRLIKWPLMLKQVTWSQFIIQVMVEMRYLI
jgi:hypothetical protein